MSIRAVIAASPPRRPSPMVVANGESLLRLQHTGQALRARGVQRNRRLIPRRASRRNCGHVRNGAGRSPVSWTGIPGRPGLRYLRHRLCPRSIRGQTGSAKKRQCPACRSHASRRELHTRPSLHERIEAACQDEATFLRPMRPSEARSRSLRRMCSHCGMLEADMTSTDLPPAHREERRRRRR